jgi:2-polyprenyl-6-methoxyphenol hydroxylase-like FAD-dependent oxidoreductase
MRALTASPSSGAAAPRRRARAAAAALDAADLRGAVVVAGGGPAGLAAAVALQRVGVPVRVLEREAAPGAGGSALGIWTNGWRALETLGAADALRALHPRCEGVELCRDDGRRLRAFALAECDGGPHEFRGVRRASLVAALAAQLAPGTLVAGATVAGVTAAPGGGCTVTLSSGEAVECAAVVGADGVRSAVAAARGGGGASYAGQVAVRGVARVAPGAAVIRQVWGAGEARAGTYPISEGELYWFVTWNAGADAPAPTAPAAIRAEAARAVAGWAHGLPAAVAATADADLSRSRLADRWVLPGGAAGRPGPPVTLAGDALHPMTPNLGQGGCCALEDGVVLARALRDAGVPAMMAGERGGGGGGEALDAALRGAFGAYERARALRCLPLTVRARGMGFALQLPLPPVVAARDAFVANLFNASHFLDHAAFDCGAL